MTFHCRWTSWSVLAALAANCLTMMSGCMQTPDSDRYEFIINIQSDPGRALPEAKVSHGGQLVGKSDERGLVRLGAFGREGESLSFQITCPEEFKSPPEPLAIVLRRIAERNRRPEYVVSCPPLLRSVIVGVRADNGPHLPVMYLGHEVARTDAAGAAHVLLRSAPEETLELTLDTKSHPLLRPKNPSARFKVGPRDEVFVLSQAFSLDVPPKRARPQSAPRGPVRIR